ncbi:DUF679 domain-containing protein [Quillaja saponaria]|uniref:DUF679 domain-containing protein n=1 Tax=Quillaja saponaria TaxID=32244 RepID=A0AAD7KYX8_QUISA|nr:DUF679 domain-containing protein [Quillaja saponaria]
MDFINVIQKQESDVGIQEAQQPLLENTSIPPRQSKTSAQKAIRKTFKGTAHLSNLLPRGTVLTFQILTPVLTHQGKCRTITNQAMTAGLLACFSISCFLLSFTDSIRDERGKVRYGIATFNGLWVIDGSVTLPPDEAFKLKLCFIDFFHGFMSILVFVAMALLDKNVIECFNPNPSEETEELLVTLPFWIGVICSLLFVVFPSKRHGIGFPLSRC